MRGGFRWFFLAVPLAPPCPLFFILLSSFCFYFFSYLYPCFYLPFLMNELHSFTFWHTITLSVGFSLTLSFPSYFHLAQVLMCKIIKVMDCRNVPLARCRQSNLLQILSFVKNSLGMTGANRIKDFTNCSNTVKNTRIFDHDLHMFFLLSHHQYFFFTLHERK